MTTPTPAEFVRDFSESYERLHVEKENAFWTTYMGLAKDADAARDDFDKKEIELSRFIQDPARLTTVREELARAEADAEGIKRGSYLGLIQKRLAEGNLDAPRYLSSALKKIWRKLVPHIADNAEAQAALLHTLTRVQEGLE